MIEKRKLTMAYFKVVLASVVLFVFIFILLANMAKPLNFTVIGKDIPDLPLGVVMVVSAVCGVFAWKVIKLLFKGAVVIHKYRKEHPVVRPSDELRRQALQARTESSQPLDDE